MTEVDSGMSSGNKVVPVLVIPSKLTVKEPDECRPNAKSPLNC